MYPAKIKLVNASGYGFLSVPGREKDLFFHATGLKGVNFKELEVGMDVTYEEVVTNDRGSSAVGVRLA